MIVNYFGRFSEALSDSDTAVFDAAASRVVASMRDASTQLRSKNSSFVTGLLTSSSATAATNSLLNNMDALIDRLDGPQRADVISGNWPAQKWLDSGALVLRTIQSQAADLSDSTIAAGVEQALLDAATDLGKIGMKVVAAAEAAGNAALNVLKVLPYLAVGLGGFILWSKFGGRAGRRSA